MWTYFINRILNRIDSRGDLWKTRMMERGREKERWGEKITKYAINPVAMNRGGVTERGKLMWVQVEVWLMTAVKSWARHHKAPAPLFDGASNT